MKPVIRVRPHAPTAPWLAFGNTTWRLFGSSFATRSPKDGGVTGSRSPLSRRTGTFERTGLPDEAAGAIMSVEAFQYAPHKRAACAEFARILQPGGRVGIICFEVDPDKVRGVPVLGVDPIPDYRPLLEAAGVPVAAGRHMTNREQRGVGQVTRRREAPSSFLSGLAPTGSVSPNALWVPFISQ